jgi:hypothetical protein
MLHTLNYYSYQHSRVHIVSLKFQKLIIIQHGATSTKTEIFISTTVRTSHLAQYCAAVMNLHVKQQY